MALQDRLDAFKADFESGRLSAQADQEVLDAMHRATDELIASGQAQRARKAGDLAPEFTLIDSDGKPVSSRELLAKGPLVVSFYRGVWCPYCNLELQALQAALPEIAARGASLVAISPQTAANSRKSQRDNKLELSDPERRQERSRQRVRHPLRPAGLSDRGLQGFQERSARFNNDPSWVLPMPARYVIGTDGIIAYAEVNPDYTQRPDPSELLPVLDRLRGQQGGLSQIEPARPARRLPAPSTFRKRRGDVRLNGFVRPKRKSESCPS